MCIVFYKKRKEKIDIKTLASSAVANQVSKRQDYNYGTVKGQTKQIHKQ